MLVEGGVEFGFGWERMLMVQIEKAVVAAGSFGRRGLLSWPPLRVLWQEAR